MKFNSARVKKIILPFIPRLLITPWERLCDRKRMKATRKAYLASARELAIETGLSFFCKRKLIEIFDGNNRLLVLSSEHLIYLKDFLQMFDYFFNVVEPVTQQRNGKGYFVVDYSKPAMHRLKECYVSFFFTSMAESLEMTEGYLRHCRPKEGDTVVDCGAYCGTSAYVFSKMVGPTGKVYSLEPDEMSYRMLLKNIKMHNLKNVIPLKVGLWSSSGTVGFHSDGSLGAGVNPVLQRPFFKSLTEIHVLSLEDFCHTYQIPNGSLVKMDIEGAEIEVMKGALAFLEKSKFEFAIASYHIVDDEMTCKRLETFLSEIGYLTKSTRTFDGLDTASLVTYAWKN
ncbi:MAG: FkbM family methyltransferase [Geobacteraceae bacterium]|nr:FkbM family methyltransferase [Geobacteraceae bacterium]